MPKSISSRNFGGEKSAPYPMEHVSENNANSFAANRFLLSLLFIPQQPLFQSDANEWPEVFKKKQWRQISLSQFAARSSREVEGILVSCFSKSEQLDAMFACAETGHDKV